MEISYDPAKNTQNITERGLSFDQAVDFDFETAMFDVDIRHDYGETRHIVLRLLNGRVHMLIFAETSKGIRIISFRKANKREVRQYEQKG